MNLKKIAAEIKSFATVISCEKAPGILKAIDIILHVLISRGSYESWSKMQQLSAENVTTWKFTSDGNAKFQDGSFII